MSFALSKSLSVATCSDASSPSTTRIFDVKDYDLAATLDSGQVFRWVRSGRFWTGVIHSRWVELRTDDHGIHARTATPQCDWSWLEDYLQIETDLDRVLATFPKVEPLRNAVNCCHGLRLLRQEPWECLASFLMSSTKQINQIKQIVALLCERFGEPLPAPAQSASDGTTAVAASP